MADQGCEGLLSPYLRKKRIQAALPHLKGRVLDFGCGSGMLAAHIDENNYLGVDIDSPSLETAKSTFPQHKFISGNPNFSQRFETIVSLAVIEHVPDPVEFLKMLSSYLEDSKSARIVVTTPHPSVDCIHYFGSQIGIFSKTANEEHQELLNRRRLKEVGEKAGLQMIHYNRFLFTANQIAVYSKVAGYEY